MQISKNGEFYTRVGYKLFVLVCFIFAGYTVLNQVIKFLNNDDSSSVNYKKFSINPTFDYPTYSFCYISTPWGTLQNMFEQRLISKYAITAKQWNLLLKGSHIEKKHWRTSLEFGNFSQIEQNNFSIEFKRFLKTFSDAAIKFETRNDNDSKKYTTSHKLTETRPFFLSYKDPDTMCFTRNNTAISGLVRTNDMIWFDIKYFKKANVNLYVYLHHTGHLVRSLGKPHLKIYGSEIEYWNSKVTLKINHVSILRRRRNSKIPCDKDLQNDDDKFLKEIIKRVGCIPVYWIPQIKDHNNNKTCRTSRQMFEIYYYLTHKEMIMAQYHQPCNYMKVSIETIQQPYYKRYILLQFTYMNENYEELLSFREFGIEGLGAGIGGYVGIFLGYSFLQIPSTLSSLWIRLKRYKTKYLETKTTSIA